MVRELKRFLIGKPIATEHQAHERLNKPTALAVFSSDALSSVAYATEAILAVLILAGTGMLGVSLPIAGAIAALLVIVGVSYRQTIRAYPNGGGAYIVARENLGEMPSLIAAGALLTDYVLTVSVSTSAGIAAIVSLAGAWGVGGVEEYAVPLALTCIFGVALANLRGVRESGFAFAIPTYIFIISMLSLITFGMGKALLGDTSVVEQAALPIDAETHEVLGIWLILRAFAAGCTALTGIEAISNGVPAFKAPESKNAAITLTWMVSLLTTMFLGLTWLANHYQAMPNHLTHETVLSQIARTVFGTGPVYSGIQVATAFILILAANTAFADFPRLASLLGRDGYIPRQFSSRGDRLVFSNGILVLAGFAALLVIIFRANEIAMLPLYAIGVFLSFTLSQTGMVQHHLRLREPHWQSGLVINLVGAILTTLVLLVLIVTKFIHGAWAVLLCLPVMVLLFRAIHQHYTNVAIQLSLSDATKPMPLPRHTAVVPVDSIHRGVLAALAFAESFAPGNVTAVHVELDPVQTAKLRERWDSWSNNVPLVILPSPYRSLIGPIMTYIDDADRRDPDDMFAVVVPEFIPHHWWEYLLHNQTAFLLRAALLLRKGKVVISVPYQLQR